MFNGTCVWIHSYLIFAAFISCNLSYNKTNKTVYPTTISFLLDGREKKAVRMQGEEEGKEYESVIIPTSLRKLTLVPKQTRIMDKIIKKEVEIVTKHMRMFSIFIDFKLEQKYDEEDWEFFEKLTHNRFRELFNEMKYGNNAEFVALCKKYPGSPKIKEKGQKHELDGLSSLISAQILKYSTNFTTALDMNGFRALRIYFSQLANDGNVGTKKQIDDNIKAVQKGRQLFHSNFKSKNPFHYIPAMIEIRRQTLAEQERRTEAEESMKGLRTYSIAPQFSSFLKFVLYDKKELTRIFNKVKPGMKFKTSNDAIEQRKVYNQFFNTRQFESSSLPEHPSEDQLTLEKLEKFNKKQGFSLETNGVDIHYNFRKKVKPLVESPLTHHIGIDYGLRNAFGAVTKDLAIQDNNKNFKNWRLTSKEYHKMTNWQNLYKHQEKITRSVDLDMEMARKDQKEQGINPYAFSNKADLELSQMMGKLKIYNSNRITRLKEHGKRRKKSTCGKIAAKLIPKVSRSAVAIGDGTCWPGLKTKHIPGSIQSMAKAIKDTRRAEVIIVDEYNTSRLCSKCYGVLKSPGRNVDYNNGKRWKRCDSCKVSWDRDINAGNNMINILASELQNTAHPRFRRQPAAGN